MLCEVDWKKLSHCDIQGFNKMVRVHWETPAISR